MRAEAEGFDAEEELARVLCMPGALGTSAATGLRASGSRRDYASLGAANAGGYFY